MERSRVIELPGVLNFRDLGGYAGLDGKHVRWGQVYRSDALTNVPVTAAQEVLRNRLDVRHAFDFRTDSEAADRPYAFDGIEHHLLPVGPSLLSSHAKSGKPFTADITRALVLQTYYARIDSHDGEFAAVLRFLVHQPADSGAVVFHCTAGKDRTGLMAALLLGALGVDEKTILDDFNLTKPLPVRPAETVAFFAGLGLDDASMDVLWSVDGSNMEAALVYLRERYGGIESYLRQKMGLTNEELAALRARLLE